MSAMSKIAVITGGSGGIGRAACEIFKNKGWDVYELSRHESAAEGITHIPCDLTDEASVSAAFASIGKEAGRVDLLINNAGGGISGAIEYTELDAAQKLFDINFFGTLRVIQAALPYLRKASRARIINMSSVAAVLAIPFQAFYSATKAAINALTLCLANELRPFKITVTALMPGDVSTGFTDSRIKDSRGNDVYCGRIESAVAVMERDERGGMAPAYIARRIARIAKKRRVKPLYAAGGKYKIFCVLQKMLPAGAANYIVGKLY